MRGAWSLSGWLAAGRLAGWLAACLPACLLACARACARAPFCVRGRREEGREGGGALFENHMPDHMLASGLLLPFLSQLPQSPLAEVPQPPALTRGAEAGPHPIFTRPSLCCSSAVLLAAAPTEAAHVTTDEHV